MKKLLIAVFIFGVVAAAALLVPRYLAEYKKSVARKTVVYIPLHSTYSQLCDSLAKAITDMEPFCKVAKSKGLQENFKPGRYTFTPDKTNKEIVRMLQYGWQTPMMLTLSGNIRNFEKLSSILGKKLAADSSAFMDCFNSDSVAKQYGFSPETFKAIVIPDTYEVYWTISPQEFLDRMKKEYDRFWTPERTSKAADLGLSPIEVSILASIVCEETNHIPEMPDVAGVYINRLKRGMKLDADPTVKYALGDPSIRRILFKHLEVDSPYNTYKYAGLPPGPITVPGKGGLDAVLNYRNHNYLYFCANSNMDGTHKFARTLQEHNRNAKEYQAALNRLKIR